EPCAAYWLPPFWFWGVCQRICGNSSLYVATLARLAWGGLSIAVFTALSLYVISYRRHASLLLDGAQMKGSERGATLTSRLAPFYRNQPRKLAIVSFTLKTLWRSRPHKMLISCICGAGIALVV